MSSVCVCVCIVIQSPNEPPPPILSLHDVKSPFVSLTLRWLSYVRTSLYNIIVCLVREKLDSKSF